MCGVNLSCFTMTDLFSLVFVPFLSSLAPPPFSIPSSCSPPLSPPPSSCPSPYLPLLLPSLPPSPPPPSLSPLSDIKPENLLISSEDVLKLCDFGEHLLLLPDHSDMPTWPVVFAPFFLLVCNYFNLT